MSGDFTVIYADPPWRYTAKKVQGAAEKHYPTMHINDICALPVAELAAKDSALFMWATFPQLPEALRVIEAWGFKFKTVAFVWLKKNKKADSWFYGLGFWTRGNAEICLLATKGHPKRIDNSVHQFIISPIEGHSKKPDEARDKILRLMGDVPRVELFARQTAPGWHAWGNEVESTFNLMTFINGIQPVTSNFFTSIGKANLGFWMSLTRQILLLVPLMLILPISFGMDGVMWSGPISDGVAALLAAFFALREFRKMNALKIQETTISELEGTP